MLIQYNWSRIEESNFSPQLQLDTITIKTNTEIKKSKSGFLFCSRSCAAEYNNKLIPKRIKTRTCKYCSKLLHSSTLCIAHIL